MKLSVGTIGLALFLTSSISGVGQAATDVVVGTLPKERDGWSLTGPGNETGPSELAAFVTDTNNFGPGGIVPDVTFSIAEIPTLTTEVLANIDILHIVFDSQGYQGNIPTLSSQELDAVDSFVSNGGRVLAFAGLSGAPRADCLLERFGMHVSGYEPEGTTYPTPVMPDDIRYGPFGEVVQVSWNSNAHFSIEVDSPQQAVPIALGTNDHEEVVLARHGQGVVFAFGDYFDSYTAIVTHYSPSSGFDVLMGNVMAYVAGDVPPLGAMLGDANNDGVVSADDFALVQALFGYSGPADGLLPGDANNDGVVSADDFAAIQAHFGAIEWVSAQTKTLPEPATLVLLAIGGMALLRRGLVDEYDGR